jgi:hypothetical protein
VAIFISRNDSERTITGVRSRGFLSQGFLHRGSRGFEHGGFGHGGFGLLREPLWRNAREGTFVKEPS